MLGYWQKRIVLGAIVVSCCFGCSIEPLLNKVALEGPYSVSEDLQALHDSMLVADMHSDSLLWNRDLIVEGGYGHVDVPRLLRGLVDFQIMSTVSKTPWGLNMQANSGDTDMLVANSMLQAWPPRTWSSLLQRVLYQGQKLEAFEKRAQGQMHIVRFAEDMARIGEKVDDAHVVATMLATEGGQVLEGQIGNLDILYDAGFRMMGLVHFYDNLLGGSAHGMQKGGITEFGKAVVKGMERRKMVVDLAHASPAMIEDVLKIVTRPVAVSHTGVKGTCDNIRNLSDQQLHKIAATGGIIGVAMFEPAVCELTMAEVARSLKYVADLVGVQHVAIGSDFDGAVKTPVDISGIAMLTDELRKLGMSQQDIGLVMGGNIVRFFKENLPHRSVGTP